MAKKKKKKLTEKFVVEFVDGTSETIEVPTNEYIKEYRKAVSPFMDLFNPDKNGE